MGGWRGVGGEFKTHRLPRPTTVTSRSSRPVNRTGSTRDESHSHSYSTPGRSASHQNTSKRLAQSSTPPQIALTKDNIFHPEPWNQPQSHATTAIRQLSFWAKTTVTSGHLSQLANNHNEGMPAIIRAASANRERHTNDVGLFIIRAKSPKMLMVASDRLVRSEQNLQHRLTTRGA